MFRSKINYCCQSKPTQTPVPDHEGGRIRPRRVIVRGIPYDTAPSYFRELISLLLLLLSSSRSRLFISDFDENTNKKPDMEADLSSTLPQNSGIIFQSNIRKVESIVGPVEDPSHFRILALSVCLSVCLPDCLPACLSVCLSVCLCIILVSVYYR